MDFQEFLLTLTYLLFSSAGVFRAEVLEPQEEEMFLSFTDRNDQMNSKGWLNMKRVFPAA